MCWIRWLTIALFTIVLTIGSHALWLTTATGKTPSSGVMEQSKDLSSIALEPSS